MSTDIVYKKLVCFFVLPLIYIQRMKTKNLSPIFEIFLLFFHYLQFVHNLGGVYGKKQKTEGFLPRLIYFSVI